MLEPTATGKHTCNHFPGSRAEPGEGCRGRRLPGGQLGNSDDTLQARPAHFTDKALMFGGGRRPPTETS